MFFQFERQQWTPVSYLTTVSARSDGSTPDPRPGAITPEGYASAPATADGQKITVAVTYTGDLAIVQRVEGLTGGDAPQFETTVNCKESGYVNTVVLSGGQTQILTGIISGSECRLSQESAGTNARFEDTSGNPGDAVVVITGTRADCWDLRNSSPSCRATVIVTNTNDGRSSRPADTREEAPTTTAPDQRDRPATTAAAAVVAAPAATPAPAVAIQLADGVTFTG